MSNIVVNDFKTHIKDKKDPANILRLQLKYERALLQKIKEIEKVIEYAIVDRDVFGLLDNYQPEFNHIGFQPILYKEVCPIQAYNADPKSLSETFGYNRPWYRDW